ncbi:MAG: hypothetical protein HY904_25345 [Deltaproteobacteria bacterium]|nr:hypothetical protein [Deltaproteobacteria bacterium]
MKSSLKTTVLFAALGAGLASTVAIAANVTLPYTFSAGTVIRAAEVNANFQAIQVANDDNQAQITALDQRVRLQEVWTPPRVGAFNLGAVDFAPTVTGTTIVHRVYDEFGASPMGAKIGAAIHPYNGSTPTQLACWFSTDLSGDPTSKVRATLWSIPMAGGAAAPGAVPLAAVELTGQSPVNTPTEFSTGAFVGPLGRTEFVTWDGVTGYRFVVEIEFVNKSYPNFKVYGCTVRWQAATAAP